MSNEPPTGKVIPGWQGCRALVTGAAGFLGANLCRTLLAAGASTHVVVRPTSDLFRLEGLAGDLHVHTVDLRDGEGVQSVLRGVRPEVVFHGAAHGAYRQEDVARAMADTVAATANLLDGLAAVGCRRLVHVGSSLEYGPASRPHREADALRPTTLRGAAKAAATLLVLQQANGGAVAGVVVRPFSIYGPWEGEHRLVPSAIRAALTGEVLPLTGPGLRRDYVFVEDVCQACLRAAVADAAVGEAFNVGTGQQTSNEELVGLVEQVTGRPVPVAVGVFPARASDRSFWVADTSKTARLLGWRAERSLSEGLERTARWLEERLARGAAG